MWRRVLAAVHPDRGGVEDGELFVWLSNVRDVLAELPGAESASAQNFCSRYSPRQHDEAADPDRIPFDPAIDHADRVFFALRWYADAPEPWRSVVMLLRDYPHASSGRREAKQRKGATWRQLAYVAHLAGMSREERREWYLIAESLGVSEAMAGHIIKRLKELKESEAL